MIRVLLAVLVALAATGVRAAEVENRGPITNTLPALEGSDDLIGGVALDLIATRDSDKFERTIGRAAAMLDYRSINDYVAIGVGSTAFRQGGWSRRVNSLGGAIRSVDPATAAGYYAIAGVALNGDRTEWRGEGAWNIRFSKDTGMELIANRDFVESMAGLERGIMANFLAVSVDHALTERLTVIGMPTYRRFSDGNEQPGMRAWLIYGLLPEHGLNAELKVRGYESSQNANNAYFSPDRYERAEIGLRLRRAFGDWRVFATADVGRERIDRDTEKPTGSLTVSGQRNFANGAGVRLEFSYYRASDSANNAGTSDRYAWRWARIFLTFPL